ncbi:hypothetical protein B0H17DRAFT_1277619 [Mycena rosella]|uniref:Uncharacterized protein n=1 Tax=Mycena rosella TaxID=1033263 RepID=A0AAD7C626_MYCRO|nr:hypothetical protein B0H17DRAFT_1277619 [Mycena rosella]
MCTSSANAARHTVLSTPGQRKRRRGADLPVQKDRLADEGGEAHEDQVEVNYLRRDEQRGGVAPARDEVVIARLRDEHEVRRVHNPFKKFSAGDATADWMDLPCGRDLGIGENLRVGVDPHIPVIEPPQVFGEAFVVANNTTSRMSQRRLPRAEYLWKFEGTYVTARFGSKRGGIDCYEVDWERAVHWRVTTRTCQFKEHLEMVPSLGPPREPCGKRQRPNGDFRTPIGAECPETLKWDLACEKAKGGVEFRGSPLKLARKYGDLSNFGRGAQTSDKVLEAAETSPRSSWCQEGIRTIPNEERSVKPRCLNKQGGPRIRIGHIPYYVGSPSRLSVFFGIGGGSGPTRILPRGGRHKIGAYCRRLGASVGTKHIQFRQFSLSRAVPSVSELTHTVMDTSNTTTESTELEALRRPQMSKVLAGDRQF